MNENIGELAGGVWNALEQKGPLTLAGLTKQLNNKSPQEISMAVGWLAREDKVELERVNKSIKVALK